MKSVFAGAIDCRKVRIRRRKWFPFQPLRVAMAPCGHIHFHPSAPAYRDDFSLASVELQGYFIHEMTHVWQHQKGLFLPFRRLPFARYGYRLKPGLPLDKYGIEQQAEIVRHAFLLQNGIEMPGKPDLSAYRKIPNFPALTAYIRQSQRT